LGPNIRERRNVTGLWGPILEPMGWITGRTRERRRPDPPSKVAKKKKKDKKKGGTRPGKTKSDQHRGGKKRGKEKKSGVEGSVKGRLAKQRKFWPQEQRKPSQGGGALSEKKGQSKER